MNTYQKHLESGNTQCLICPRECELAEGKQGYCRVRQNVNGNIHLISYGYTTGLAIDPIEKKPLYHFLPGSRILSFGTRGCNMGCLFCQNWSISKSTSGQEGLRSALPADIAQTAQHYACPSVAFTYNEPTVFFEYALDTAKECRDRGIRTVAVSAGYMNPEPRAEFYQLIDAVNIDLKAFSNRFYEKNCNSKLDAILDTIQYIKKETDTWLELTTLIIEGENDFEDDLKKECDWIAENTGTATPLHFSAFRPAWKFQDHSATRLETLLKACKIAKAAGLKHVYTGNIPDRNTSATYCEVCQKPLITRDHYQTEQSGLDRGCCIHCGAKLSGIFL
ncbi:MAG: AmmeMemoRadiSam system radical SAM enzyme [Planctomycetia bacterium]|nr:AmmeMemoRadiSam system radical SAM enzyme [Planctomycetia bacterium]